MSTKTRTKPMPADPTPAEIQEVLATPLAERLSREQVARMVGRTAQMVSAYTVTGYQSSGIRLKGVQWLGGYVYRREWVEAFLSAVRTLKEHKRKQAARLVEQVGTLRQTKKEQAAVKERLRRHGI